MENSLHHLLMTNHTAFRKRIFSALKNEGLTSGQPKVLEYLAEHDGAMQKDIAAACRIEPATMTSLLCGMEGKRDLITRSAPDRRSLSVYLTEKGRMLIPLIKEEFSRIEDRATCGFSNEERELLISLLSRMRENLEHEECILIKFMTVIPVTVRIMTAGKPLTRKLTPVT